MKNLLIRFGKGESLHKLRVFFLLDYLKTVEDNQSRVTSKEYLIAYKISGIKKFNLEEIMSEKVDIKKFAKEVGMKFSEIKGMEDDDLIREIICRVSQDETYSDELKVWYQKLPDEYFEGGDNGDINYDELIEAIEDADDIETLHSIIEMEEYESVFNKKLLKLKEVEELQEKMTEAIEKAMESSTEKEEKPAIKTTTKKEEKEMANTEEVSKEEMIEAINETAEVSELRELVKGYPEMFKGVNTKGGKLKAETLKADMLEALGAGGESGDITFEELEEMDLADLEEFAKDNDIEYKLTSKFPNGKKKELLAILKEAMEGAESGEVEINQSTVMEWIKAKDLESLCAAAEELGIKLNIIQKKNARKAGEAIIEAITEKAEKTEKKGGKEKAEKKSEKVDTPFSVMAKMVSEGEDEDECVKVVSKMLKALGVSVIDSKKKAKALYEIAALSAE